MKILVDADAGPVVASLKKLQNRIARNVYFSATQIMFLVLIILKFRATVH